MYLTQLSSHGCQHIMK